MDSRTSADHRAIEPQVIVFAAFPRWADEKAVNMASPTDINCSFQII
jgi:hypothetical protein